MTFSFQLYSARKIPLDDAFLSRLAGLGYTQVEGFGGLYDEAEELAAALEHHRLRMSTGHFGLNQLEDKDFALRTVETLGIRYLYCPAIPQDERVKDEAGWVALGETLARLGETFRSAGYGFGWHNHAFEFAPLANGRMPMDILLETAELNDWEMDVAWVVKGGQDPVSWIERYGQRINAVHVKDLAPEGENADEDGWADVGHGRLDWAALARTIKDQTNAQYWVMEHDNPSDVTRFAERSMAAVSAWK